MIELLLFGLAPEVKPSPLIQTITEIQTVQVEPPQEPTLEEKIATNYYKCDESIQYIRADNAMCISRPTNRRLPIENTGSFSHENSAPVGYYPKGQCTHLVWSLRPVPAWGNATNWKYRAEQAGWYVGSKPIAGAIGWVYGHVVYILEVKDNTVVIKEANYDYKGSVRVVERPISNYTYIY